MGIYINLGGKKMINDLIKRISLFFIVGVFFIMLPINVMAGCSCDQIKNHTGSAAKGDCRNSHLARCDLSNVALGSFDLSSSDLSGNNPH